MVFQTAKMQWQKWLDQLHSLGQWILNLSSFMKSIPTANLTPGHHIGSSTQSYLLTNNKYVFEISGF